LSRSTPFSSYYESREYVGALVYDAYGLYAGTVCRVSFSPAPRIIVCNDPTFDARVPDYRRLLGELRRRGLVAEDEEPSLEELVVLAREQTLEIPYTSSTQLGSIVKLVIEPQDMESVDNLDDTRLIVLLSEPREARLRGVDPPKPLSQPTPETVAGKHVLSHRSGYLGRASTIAIGPRGVAVRVVKKGSPSWRVDELLHSLRRSGYVGVAEQVERLASSARGAVEAHGEVLRILEALRVPGEALQMVRSSKRYMVEEKRDIPWDQVIYVADAVITS